MPEAHDAHHNVFEAKQQDFTNQNILNEPASGVPYYTPAQRPPAGTASDPQPDGSPLPKLFRPLKIRGVTLQNRIMACRIIMQLLSPHCANIPLKVRLHAFDSATWELTHLGGILQRGPGLTMVEATAVTPEGRITPEDAGLWKDSQMAPLKYTVDFAHSQGQRIAIQLAHAGRKASTVAPWLSRSAVAPESVGGWPDNVLAPSDVAYPGLANPRAMTKEDIEHLKSSWVAAVQRAVKIGFDVIEIHNAHGYLLHSFLSPVSNKRTDEYGGSFENRVRLTLEIVELTRQNVPEDMPIFLRISATDWLEHEQNTDSWQAEDTVRLAEILASKGVDLIDVSSGGLHPKQQVKSGPGYQAPFAQKVKERLGDKLLVGTVGSITNGKQANELLESGLDLAIVGRMFQKNPGLVWTFAEELDVEINAANQIRWGFGGKVGARKQKGKI